MRFIADECVDGRVVRRLIADGHELLVARKSFKGWKDTMVLAESKERDCLLITEDKDFGELVFRLRAVHAGVVLIRLHGLSGPEQAERVSHVIREQAAELKYAFTVIGLRRMRIRKDRSSSV